MIFKKKYLLTSFLIIILQILLYTSNNQKTSFKYFKWSLQKVSIGKLISISFVSGFFISTILNATSTTIKKNNLENAEENIETQYNEEELESNIDMPPQRDIRDAQPTISVNYRVVKNMDKNLQNDQTYSSDNYKKDDWDYDYDDW